MGDRVAGGVGVVKGAASRFLGYARNDMRNSAGE